jgi:class 3 adenylate cyclase/predicted ATPase
VLFCDLVGSTALSAQLDPEDLREVIRAYHQVSATVIGRFEGHTAQYLGDGLLVYFGYPVAHEDDAQRAVRTALGIVEAVQHLSFPTIPLPHPLQVRIGIHTGVVVVGEVGSRAKHEILALGETPNLAARLQGVAEPETVVISAASARLVQGFFALRRLGPHTLRGSSARMEVYQVLAESGRQSRLEVAGGTGLTPFVGREEERGLLQRRWAQAKAGAGQAVLLSGEPGIGKSRLVQTLTEQANADGAIRIELRCSAYHQNSAFYPMLEHMQRFLQFAPHEAPHAKLRKLTQRLATYRFPQSDTLPLLAAWLALPQPEGAPPLALSPRKQKQKTQEALVAWIVEEAERSPVYCVWEDPHWADPSTLEVLTLFLEQVPTTRVLTLLTFRPDFTPPWPPRPHLTHLTLQRLGQPQVKAMVEHMTGEKALPSAALQQIVAKTDGVPLFVEELTKMVLESEVAREEDGRDVGVHNGAPLSPLTIPVTLQDLLMARLDRLAPVRELAQVGAVLGREFSYELLYAVAPGDEARLQQGLRQLVEAELLSQHGLPPQATYIFKHALLQDTAYQSLLRSRRQQLHQTIGQVLEARFPETAETQPELVAHHYTEAGLTEQAIAKWQQAGHRDVKRSANVEAVRHFTKALELLQTLPDTPERPQHELALLINLGAPLVITRGYAAPEVGTAYVRARELCQQIGETPQLFLALAGLLKFYLARGELQTAQEMAEQLLRLAQQVQDPTLVMTAHASLGVTSFYRGALIAARTHLEQAITLYDPHQHGFLVRVHGDDLGTNSLSFLSWTLWRLGYPDQALHRSQEALTLAHALAHPYAIAFALGFAPALHQYRGEAQQAQEQAEALIRLANDQGMTLAVAQGTLMRAAALVRQGESLEEGVAQIRQGLSIMRAVGYQLAQPAYLAFLAEAYGRMAQAEEGLTVLAEALAIVRRTGECHYEAELYRLQGELILQSQGPDLQSTVDEEAEQCFHQAIAVARTQHAKSWELRAATSLARLWHRQGKQEAARQLLGDIYGWFTEGFDTHDLRVAQALLEELR